MQPPVAPSGVTADPLNKVIAPPEATFNASQRGRGGDNTGCGGGEGGCGGGGGEVTTAPAPSSQWSGLGHTVVGVIPDADVGVDGSGDTTLLLARLPLHSLSPLSQ